MGFNSLTQINLRLIKFRGHHGLIITHMCYVPRKIEFYKIIYYISSISLILLVMQMGPHA